MRSITAAIMENIQANVRPDQGVIVFPTGASANPANLKC